MDYWWVNWILLSLTNIVSWIESLPQFTSSEIDNILEHSCIILSDVSASPRTKELLHEVGVIFENEQGVKIGQASIKDFIWPNGLQLKYDTKVPPSLSERDQVVFFKRRIKDRSCLHDIPTPNRPLIEKRIH